MTGTAQDWTGVITRGRDGATQRTWPVADRLEVTWPDLVDWLDPIKLPRALRDQPKDGRCFIPGTLRSHRQAPRFSLRSKLNIASICLLVADLDMGSSLESLVVRLKRAGVAALITTTHSHRRCTLDWQIAEVKWRSAIATLGAETTVVRLWADRHLAPGVLSAGWQASWQPMDSARGTRLVGVRLRMPEGLPKYRVLVPLATPWLPDPALDSTENAARWSVIYRAAIDGLGLWDADTSCADAGRLYYDARWPANGVDGCARALEGPPASLPCLLRRATQDWGHRIGRAELVVWEAFQRQRAASLVAIPRQLGRGGRRTRYGQSWYVTWPERGRVDLDAWHRRHAWVLDLPALITAHAPGWLDPRGAALDGEGVHVVCPCVEEHASRAGGGTFVFAGTGLPERGADTWRDEHRRGAIHCMHNACADRGRGEMLAAMLTVGMLDFTMLEVAEAEVTEIQKSWNADEIAALTENVEDNLDA